MTLSVEVLREHGVAILDHFKKSANNTLTHLLMDLPVAISSKDIVPLNQVRARFSELADEVREGKEKIITRNGESYVALIDARRLDHYHQLEREHIHLTLLEEANRGWDDVEAGRLLSVAETRAKYKKSRSR
jgi:prevent-host-death family protein